MGQAAGWYRDPFHRGQERYWDGRIWTQGTRAEGAESAAGGGASTEDAAGDQAGQQPTGAFPGAPPAPAAEPSFAPLGAAPPVQPAAAPPAGGPGTWAPPTAGSARPGPSSPATGYNPYNPYGPPPPEPRLRPTHQSRRTFAVVLVAVAVFLVGAGVVVFALNGNGTNPKEAVANAVANLHHARTAEVAISLTIGANGQVARITGNGETNVLTNATNETIHYDLAGTSFTARAIMDGPTAFFNYGDGVGRIVPGKSWVSMNIGQSGGSSQSTGIYNDPVAMVAVLGSGGTVVRALGASDHDGISVQGYSIDLGPVGIARLMRSTNFPASVKDELASTHFSHLDYSAYIDASNRLRDVRTVATYSVDGHQFTAQGDMSLSDYGVPVTITDPPANEVIPLDQFNKIAAQSQGTASS